MKKLLIIGIAILMLSGCGDRPPEITSYTFENDMYKFNYPSYALVSEMEHETIVYGKTADKITTIKIQVKNGKIKGLDTYKDEINGYVCYTEYHNQLPSGGLYKHSYVILDNKTIEIYFIYGTDNTDGTIGYFLGSFELK